MLWRDHGTTQVGLARPLIFSGLTAQDQDQLARMEGAGIARSSKFSAAGRVAIVELQLAGMLEADTGKQEATVPTRIAIHGLSSPGLAAALNLASRPATILELVDPAPVITETRGLYGVLRGTTTCAGAASDAIRRAYPLTPVHVGASKPDVAIVVSVGSPDFDVCIPYMTSDTPHLLVIADDLGATVGPMVLPGLTPCAICISLDRTQSDPNWLQIATQLNSTRRPRLNTGTAALTGALSANIIDALLSGSGHWYGNQRWRIEEGAEPRRILTAINADCGCGDAAVTYDGVPAS